MSSAGSTDSEGFPTYQDPADSATDFDTISFIIQQQLAYVRTCQLVQVKTVHNGDIGPVGTVDVQLLINQMDGQGNTTSHGTILNVPIFRLQGGGNAIICDPAVNDIGFAGFCDRDISSVKKTKKVGNPGSWRLFDVADAIYFGGVLNAAPTQYWRFSSAGIDMKDSNGNTIVADTNGITINGVKFDRSQNVSNVNDFTNTGNTSLSGGSKKVVLDGDPVSGGVVHASSTKTTAT